MPYPFAIIGCQHGHISTFIREMLDRGHSCSGIYDAGNPKLARMFSERYGIPLVDEVETLLDSSVQIIGSSAINNEKIDIVEMCERYGKHVMVDKPIVTGRAGLERLEAVIKRGTIQVGMLLTERFRPAVHALKQKIAAGELGDIVSISMRKPHNLKPASRHAWHFSSETNGGIIVDLFIHDFDLLRWLTGREIVSVQSMKTKNMLPEYPTFYDTACAQIQLEGGIIGQLYADWHTPGKSWTWGDCRIFVSGTAGCAELRMNGDPAVSAKEELLFRITHDEPFGKVEPEIVPVTVSEDFLRRIEGQPGIITHRDVLLASRASVEADENAVVIDNTATVHTK